jgi:signal transduction histidine kinase
MQSIDTPNPTTPDDVFGDADRLDRQLASLQQQLAESQRLATVGTIAAVIAHEFNNLLTPITSYCQMAMKSIDDGKEDPAFTRKALDKSLNHAMRAGRICSSLLGLVRGQSDHETLSVQKIVEESLSVLARDPSKDGIALRLQIKPELRVRGDSVQLEQVLLNLLINARQALLQEGQPRGGSITIRADLTDEGRVKLSISDTGPGIPMENLERIFEPFFTTKTNPKRGEHRGSGLGLHICRQIVEQHGGQISVQSTLGNGTTFEIELPGIGE